MFLIAVVCLASCARKSEEQLYKEGQTQESQNNFQLAVQSYQEIVDHYVLGKYADSAQFRIGKIYNNDLRDIEKAVAAYQQVYTKFPQSTFAPTAMFLTGFLMNNELHKLDSARVLYEAFLQQYPNHDLAVSARFELETLGKDPTQFLPREEVAKMSRDSTARRKAAKR